MFENSNTGGALLQTEFIFLLQRQTSSATNDPENSLFPFPNIFNNTLIGWNDQKKTKLYSIFTALHSIYETYYTWKKWE